MKALLLALAIGIAGSAAQAQRAPEPVSLPQYLVDEAVDPSSPTTKRSGKADEAELLSHRHYKAKNGQEVHSPAKSSQDIVPAGATAKCRDGSYSFSQHRRGTCSHHGGVGAWL